MNFMITCEQTNPDMRAVIISSNAGSILGHRVAATTPTVFLHNWDTVVGKSALKIVSRHYDSATREEAISFTSENGSYADVRILGVADDFAPGVYEVEVSLGIFAYSFAMRANSITCEALLDRAAAR